MKVLKNEQGFSLIEVLLSLAIIGLTASVFLFAIQTSSKATLISDVRVDAKNLAISQMDTIKAEEYVPAPSGGVAAYSFNSPSGNFQVCTLDRANNQISNQIYGIPWDITTDSAHIGSDDPGIQKITVIIKSASEEVFRLVGFKVDR